VNLETEGDATAEAVSGRRRSVLDESELSTDESTAGDLEGPDPEVSQAQRRARVRVTRHLAEAIGLAGGMTRFLESRSVSDSTLKTYRAAVGRFRDFAARLRLPLGADESVDAALVQFFTAEYFNGYHPCGLWPGS
jgi:hypothetical protein